MTDNIEQFPQRDMVAEMTGPETSGVAVIIDGRLVPHMTMRDKGEVVELILDNTFVYQVPRESAWTAAGLAFHAMSIGAGFPSPEGKHFSQRDFAPRVARLEISHD